MWNVIIFIGLAIVVFAASDWIQKNRRSPEHLNRLLQQAAQQFDVGNYYSANNICDQILEKSQDWRAYQIKGMSYFRLGQRANALENAKKSLILEPNPVTNELSYMIVTSLEG